MIFFCFISCFSSAALRRMAEQCCSSRGLHMLVLLQAYGSNGQLVVNYANTPAWG